jgi:hypothetical protein
MTNEEIREAFERAGLPSPSFSAATQPVRDAPARRETYADSGSPLPAAPYRPPMPLAAANQYAPPPAQAGYAPPYPPPPYPPYMQMQPLPPQPAPAGFGYHALLWTGLLSAGLAAGATYFAKAHFTPPRPPPKEIVDQRVDTLEAAKKQKCVVVSCALLMLPFSGKTFSRK